MLLMATINSMVMAASFTMRTAQCPIGEGQVRIYDVVSDNQLGGFDSDLATYSSGEQARHFLLSTCTTNYLSLYGEDMGRVFPDELANAMLQQTETVRQSFQDPQVQRFGSDIGLPLKITHCCLSPHSSSPMYT